MTMDGDTPARTSSVTPDTPSSPNDLGNTSNAATRTTEYTTHKDMSGLDTHESSHSEEAPMSNFRDHGEVRHKDKIAKTEGTGVRSGADDRAYGEGEENGKSFIRHVSNAQGPDGGQEDGDPASTGLSAHHHTSWIDLAQRTVIGPASPGTPATRPTSVPIMQGRSSQIDDHVEHHEHPSYADQPYADLPAQQHLPRQHHYPHHPPPLRTRNSNPSQHSSYSSLSYRQSREFPSMVAGAKTVGCTPSQSPGLYSPSYPRSKASTDNLEDVGYQTPQLHPTHNHPPIETHKLQKDVDPISGDKRINNYQIIRRLGNGQHGTVKLAKNIDNDEEVAIKIVRRFAKRSFRRTSDPSEMIKKEVAILKKARHPHVVSLLEVIDDVEFNKVYLILEFVALGEIVWRKQTVKDVAVFEMERVQREKAGVVDPEFEVAEIEKFNQNAIAKRGDKARVVRQRKQESGQLVDPDHWSLEYGTGSDDGQGFEHDQSIADPGVPIETDEAGSQTQGFGRSRYEDLPAYDETPRASDMLQSGTPKALPRTWHLNEPPADPNLISDQLAESEGLPPYEHQVTASDTKLRTMITDFIDMEKEWTVREDEYRNVACLTIHQARDVFRDTVLGLEYLHFQGIIHRDIKPANLLWTAEQRVKISDFGVSYLGKPIRDDDDPAEVPEDESEVLDEAIELAKTRGTPAFYAPELCDPDLFDEQKTPVRPQITGQIDVWSLGVTLYCMIFGRLPFIDESEMAMYEKIAHEEVFVPHVRLKAVEDSAKAPMGSHKRLDDLVEYEDVGDELADLIRRLLDKDPTKRMTLKEVKHHPWVLQGIQDQALWVDETDPSVQSQGRKIEVSNEEVQDAVVGLSFRDFVKSSWRRVNSVLGRGRDGSKRGDRSTKSVDRSQSTSTSNASNPGQESRRASIMDADTIPQALRASREREPWEHPLAQSQTANVEGRAEFDRFHGPAEGQARASLAETAGIGLGRALSNADSAVTVRPPASGFGSSSSRSSSEFITSLISSTVENSASGLNNLLGGAGRLLHSRDRASGRNSPSQSSRASSVDLDVHPADDRHASASIALSSASAAGLLDQPPVLRDDVPQSSPVRSVTSSPSRPRSFADPTSDSAYRTTEHSMRRGVLEQNVLAQLPPEPATPAAEPQSAQAFPADVEEGRLAHGEISSSSDQIASNISDQFSHPSMPSVTSGASSTSIAIQEEPASVPKMVLTAAEPVSEDIQYGSTANARMLPSRSAEIKISDASRHEEDVGYNAGGEQDSDSDDDGLTMG